MLSSVSYSNVRQGEQTAHLRRTHFSSISFFKKTRPECIGLKCLKLKSYMSTHVSPLYIQIVQHDINVMIDVPSLCQQTTMQIDLL